MYEDLEDVFYVEIMGKEDELIYLMEHGFPGNVGVLIKETRTRWNGKSWSNSNDGFHLDLWVSEKTLDSLRSNKWTVNVLSCC